VRDSTKKEGMISMGVLCLNTAIVIPLLKDILLCSKEFLVLCNKKIFFQLPHKLYI